MIVIDAEIEILISDIKQLKIKGEAAVEHLREENYRLREALEKWINATPTKPDGTYCEINHWHACRAREALEGK
jgi:hypothetical protein